VKTWIAVWKEIGRGSYSRSTPRSLQLPQEREGRCFGTGDLPQIVGFKLDQVQSHLIITNHLVQTGGMMINQEVFSTGLSKQDQDLILKASKDACQWANEKMKRDEAKLLLELQRKGMQVIIPDADSFRTKGSLQWRGSSRLSGPSPHGPRSLHSRTFRNNRSYRPYRTYISFLGEAWQLKWNGKRRREGSGSFCVRAEYAAVLLKRQANFCWMNLAEASNLVGITTEIGGLLLS